MRARLVSYAIIVFACSGCVSAGALRAHADRGAPIVTRHVAAPLEPATGLALVNPLVCFDTGTAGGGDALGIVALMVACVGVLGAVDLVALPVQAIRRHNQQVALERIGSACPLADPAPQVADGLSAVMVQDFHFSPPPPDPAEKPASAVTLEVRTATFTRSSRIHWEGAVAFRAPDDAILWQDACAAEAPAREPETFEHECDAARAEIAALADQCVRSVTHRLRDAWPRESGPSSSSATSEEVNAWRP
jgi:hypothetical protein